MNECVDGEYQAFKAKGGAYVRDNFFGKYPELKELVSTMTDKDIWRLNRGGHDPIKFTLRITLQCYIKVLLQSFWQRQ